MHGSTIGRKKGRGCQAPYSFHLLSIRCDVISGFRWSFYGISDVNVVVSAGMALGFLMLCLAAAWWIFRTEYKLKA